MIAGSLFVPKVLRGVPRFVSCRLQTHQRILGPGRPADETGMHGEFCFSVSLFQGQRMPEFKNRFPFRPKARSLSPAVRAGGLHETFRQSDESVRPARA